MIGMLVSMSTEEDAINPLIHSVLFKDLFIISFLIILTFLLFLESL